MKNILLKSSIATLAFIFIIFGANKFLHFMTPPPPTDLVAQLFMVGMFNSYLGSLVGIVEIFSSILLLYKRTRFLGFLAIIPIILNILLFHVTTNDALNPVIIIISVIFGAVCYSQKEAVKELFKIQSNI
jgi:putative oxidoreductase